MSFHSWRLRTNIGHMGIYFHITLFKTKTLKQINLTVQYKYHINIVNCNLSLKFRKEILQKVSLIFSIYLFLFIVVYIYICSTKSQAKWHEIVVVQSHSNSPLQWCTILGEFLLLVGCKATIMGVQENTF